MLIGYARTSTHDQHAGLEAQERDLRAAGCERLYSEQVSSVDVVRREKLAEALDYVRDGDVLIVTKLDRLARSVAHLLTITDALKVKGASLRVLDLGIDTASSTGALVMTVMAGIGAWERNIMLERQREGIAKARLAGKYRGRKPTARALGDEVLNLHSAGVGATEIAKRLGIGRASVYRILTSGAS